MIVAALNELYLAAKRIVTNARPITIITYHSISKASDLYAISPEAFARQIKCISAHYNIARLRHMRDIFSHNNNEQRTVILTFDDAYSDFLEAAYPILRNRSVPCTVFVVSGLIGKHNEWDSHSTDYSRRPIMSSSQLVELQKDGLVDYGSHTVNHPSLPSLSISEMRRQVLESTKTLAALFDCRITMFSYPFGHFSKTTTRVLLEANYDIAVTTRWGTLNNDKDMLTLKRITLSEHDSDSDIRAKIDGRYDIYYSKGLGSKLRSYSSMQ